MSTLLSEFRCKTRCGLWAHIRMRPWKRTDFVYLGTIEFADVVKGRHYEPWAWGADGRSIDRDDRGFDLLDFKYTPPSATDAPYAFWLGKDGHA